ncbi:MAG: metallophosphoesterase [Alphaproteobacteria bacterium]|nr:metallophosphoesterase [Alphaproteobacteria bacterium]MBU0858485.1 metallophosphoesterase [Alphaproteobacteria bacterium]
MRIAHLSDLHFGTAQDQIVVDVLDALRALSPHLIVISGDFTQTGSPTEYKLAAAFIAALPASAFCVPGNHDISRYNLWGRLTNPYDLYKRYIAPGLEPFSVIDGILIAGVNTARRVLPHWNWANGAISAHQRKELATRLSQMRDALRIVVMHHPLHKAEDSPLDVTVFGAGPAMDLLREQAVDIVLTGHVHHASVTVQDDTVFISASTAISGRVRQQKNGFNIIDIDDNSFTVTHYIHDGSAFGPNGTSHHERRRAAL